MARTRLVVGNWKMDPATIADAVVLARAVRSIPGDGVTVGVAPPSVALAQVAEALHGSRVRVYAQDVHWEERGAFTSQIAASMVKGVAEGSIVGHSEVRRELGDDDERVAKKMVTALRNGLHVIVCVGETEEEYVDGKTDEVVSEQIRVVVRALYDADETGEMSERFVVAYEPIWAIGTGRPATGAHASQAARTLRSAMEDEAGIHGDVIPVLYGGSVSAASVVEFARADGIDGALVGGASLKAEEFAAIVAAFRGTSQGDP